MPPKHHAARRHRIPRGRHRARYWQAYKRWGAAATSRCGWTKQRWPVGVRHPAAHVRRSAPLRRSGDRGGAEICGSSSACPCVRRQVWPPTCCACSASPARAGSHRLSRRSPDFAGRQPRVRAGDDPLHLVLDSTGRDRSHGPSQWEPPRPCQGTRGKAMSVLAR